MQSKLASAAKKAVLPESRRLTPENGPLAVEIKIVR
jgi:hypothetical protein